MLIDGIELVEGASIENLGVPIGVEFPNTPNYGELFYRTDEDILYIYATTESDWIAISKGVAETSKWIIDTADKIYHVDDVGIGAQPVATKKLYVLGDIQFDGDLDMGVNIITTSTSPTTPNTLVNKNYVDGFVSGVIWDTPIRHVNLIDDTLSTPPLTPGYSDIYIVNGVGLLGWDNLDGKIVQWNGSVWIDQGLLLPNMRFGVAMETTTLPNGAFLNAKNSIATFNGTTFDIVTPIDKRAVFVAREQSLHAYHQYVYDGVNDSWIEFGGPNKLVDGANLQFTGNTLDVIGGHGSGLDADYLDGAELTDLDAKYLNVDGVNSMSGVLRTNTLIIPAVTKILSASSAVQGIIYDSTSDTDLGFWTKLIRSWSIENGATGIFLGTYVSEFDARIDGSGVSGDWFATAGDSTRFYRLDGISGSTEVFRAGTTNFPKKSLLVVYTTKVIIYDLTTSEPSMWMVFNDLPAGSMISHNNDVRSIAMVDGILCVVGAYGVALIDFVTDTCIRYRDNLGAYSFLGRFNGVISQRNDESIGFDGIINEYIAVDLVHDVKMVILPNTPVNMYGLRRPTILAATNAGTSFISQSGAIYDSSFNGIVATQAIIDTLLYTTISTTDSRVYVADLTLINADAWSLSGNKEYRPDVAPYTLPDSGNGFTTGENRAGTSGITFIKSNHANYDESLVAHATRTYATGWLHGDTKACFLSDITVGSITSVDHVIGGTFDVDVNAAWLPGNNAALNQVGIELEVAYTDTDLPYALQSITGLTVGQEYTLSLVAHKGTAVSYNILGSSIGDPILNSPDLFDTIEYSNVIVEPRLITFVATTAILFLALRSRATALTESSFFDNIVLREAVSDRSVFNNSPQLTGTLTKTKMFTNGDLVGFSGFAPANYIRQTYTQLLATPDAQCIMGWVKASSFNTLQTIMSRGLTDSDEAFRLQVKTDGSVYFDYGIGSEYTLTPASAIPLNQWTFIVAYVELNQPARIFINAVESAYTLNGTAPAVFNDDFIYETWIGLDYVSANPWSDSLALLRFSTTIPTDEQIQLIFETERQMIRGNCVIDGQSTIVTGIDYNKKHHELTVITDWGRSTFSELTRVNSMVAQLGIPVVITSDGDIVFESGLTSTEVRLPEIDLRNALIDKESS